MLSTPSVTQGSILLAHSRCIVVASVGPTMVWADQTGPDRLRRNCRLRASPTSTCAATTCHYSSCLHPVGVDRSVCIILPLSLYNSLPKQVQGGCARRAPTVHMRVNHRGFYIPLCPGNSLR